MARRKLSSEMNVVPYIDVMLVLLVIFMVTAPLMTQGIEVDLPDVKAQSMSQDDEDRILSVDPKGGYHLNWVGEGKPVVSDDDVVTEVQGLLAKKPEQMILVHGDRKTPYENVARAMGLLSDAGAKKIGFVTDEPQEERARR
ncbi:protein TolR [Solimonas sp. K1W22B-7]|uniref:protein TolR n=1 Tax=Solimonas sp. K1W22B-7 TaxID=2303331 RepID=UPI000E335DCB|nr:protein TolR [Solimonas sp. K1W22B-7]AXQ29574.1 protein TolR [Solimonas sp. K1W22B-7]